MLKGFVIKINKMVVVIRVNKILVFLRKYETRAYVQLGQHSIVRVADVKYSK